MDWIKIAENVSVILGALLAIDNVIDGLFKALGYKEGDTVCGQVAELLNRAKGVLSTTPVQPLVPTEKVG